MVCDPLDPRGGRELGTGMPWSCVVHLLVQGLAHGEGFTSVFLEWRSQLMTDTYGPPFLWDGDGAGSGTGAAPPVCLRLTFSQRWAAACGGQRGDCEPGGPWGSSSTHLRHPRPTGISCVGACGRLRPVCTPHSAARQRGAVRLGRWVSLPTQSPPGPEDLSGLAGGTPTASSPSANIHGEQTPG